MDNYITMSRSSATEKWNMRHCNSRFFYTLRTTNAFQFQEADLSESPTTIPEVDLLLLLLVLPQERGFKKGLYTFCLHRSVLISDSGTLSVLNYGWCWEAAAGQR